MRQLSLLFLLIFTITNSFCQGKKVVLEEVEVKEKAIPEITILGIRYSYRERDFFIKTLLTQPFLRKDFKMKLDLSYFYETKQNDFLIKGETDELYLIDFGFSKIYMDKNNNHNEERRERKLIGTSKYSSVNIHKGIEASRRDDMESLCYTSMAYIIL